MKDGNTSFGTSCSFKTTQWSIVFGAAERRDSLQREAAQEQLVRLYWLPLCGLARRLGLSHQDAEDAVQTMWARLLSRSALSTLDKEGGHFRSFLKTVLKNQLASNWRACQSSLRFPAGGFAPVDAATLDCRLARDIGDGGTPEQTYDRLCAEELFNSALEALADEYRRAGKEALFTHFIAFLDRDSIRVTHAEVAERLGLNCGTVRNQIMTFRQRFRVLFREHAARTIGNTKDLNEEIRHLIVALHA